MVGPQSRLALWMLTGAVFCVLLIGVTNITSLSLARSAGREREFALRSALGASRGRVFVNLFTESLTLAVLSGLRVFWSRGRAFRSSWRSGLPIWCRWTTSGSMRRRSSGRSGSFPLHRDSGWARSRDHHGPLESAIRHCTKAGKDTFGWRIGASDAARARRGGICAGDRAARRRRPADAQLAATFSASIRASAQSESSRCSSRSLRSTPQPAGCLLSTGSRARRSGRRCGERRRRSAISSSAERRTDRHR